ncbi:hypothetical protein [Micromonospora sp. WMMD998]|uniref:hypothetical protein n=1 Tax=Micromonospora sp. WMMD998 TaxID=3016092 RepID=UPI00249B59FF|nr:hypothetical protein [Micromonospora sp. WMMD998]WFE39000.1 hypothetical protein O7619_11410 [Micromonospora sp. WMMD998]
MIDSGERDRLGRRVTLRPVSDDNWRPVADVAPRDDQRVGGYFVRGANEGSDEG